MKTSKILFSITVADLREERYRGSGAGGQNRNKRDTGIRFTHEPSGATAECEQERSQLQNRRKAFEKLANHPKLQAWMKMQAAAIEEGFANIDRKIDALMAPENIKIELTDKCKPGEIVCIKDK